MGERVRVKVHSAGREIEVEAITEDVEAALNLVDQLLVKLEPAPEVGRPEAVPSTAVPFSASGAELAPPVTESKLPDALMQLLGSDWGRTPRTLREISEALKLSAKHYALPVVSTALARLTKAGQVRRLKKGEVFSYVGAKR